MKKMLFLIIIIGLLIFAYSRYYKTKTENINKPKPEKTLIKPKKQEIPSLMLDLRPGETVKVGSKNFAKVDIELISINKDNSIDLLVYKSRGRAALSMDYRKIIPKTGTIEVKLLSFSKDMAKIAVKITSGPKEKLEIIKNKN